MTVFHGVVFVSLKDFTGHLRPARRRFLKPRDWTHKTTTFINAAWPASCWLLMRQPKRCCIFLPLRPVPLRSFTPSLRHTETVTEWAWKRRERRVKRPTMRAWWTTWCEVSWRRNQLKKTQQTRLLRNKGSDSANKALTVFLTSAAEHNHRLDGKESRSVCSLPAHT